MKPNIAYQRAFRAVTHFEKEIDGALSISGQIFTNAVYRSFAQFAEEDSYIMFRKSSDEKGSFALCVDDTAKVCAPGDSGAWNELLTKNRFQSFRDNDGIHVCKQYRSWLVIPVLAKKDAFLTIIIAREGGRFHESEIRAAEKLGEYFTQAFRNIRSKNKKANSLADETRHRMLLHTQGSLNRDQEGWPGLARAVDYSATAGSDFALFYRYGEDTVLVCTGDITAGDTERQSGLIYLDTWFSLLSQTSLDARGMLLRLNLDMVKRSVECYASIALMRYTKKTNKVDIAGCGNTGVIHFSHETMSVRIMEFGPAAGIGKETDIPMQSIAVKAGDILCAFTDGISGTRKRNGDLFGKVEIGELVRKNYFLSAEDLSSKILACLTEKEEKDVNKDDRTLQILKIE